MSWLAAPCCLCVDYLPICRPIIWHAPQINIDVGTVRGIWSGGMACCDLGAVICLCARVQHPGRLPAPSRRYDVPAGLLMAASLLFCHLSPAAGRMGRMGCFSVQPCFNAYYNKLRWRGTLERRGEIPSMCTRAPLQLGPWKRGGMWLCQ